MSELYLVQIGLREALADAQEAAKGVAIAVGVLTHIYPATLDGINAMIENEQLATDALFYRYGGLVSLIQDKLFRAVANIEQEDRAGATRREITELKTSCDRFSKTVYGSRNHAGKSFKLLLAERRR